MSDGRRKRCLAQYDHKLDRILDPTVPVLAWHPTAPILAHIHEAKGRVFLTTTNVESKERAERELFRIEKVIHLDWSPDGRSIAFGGVRAGQSDVHVFNTLAGSQVPLWEDPWDDLEPDWLPDGSGLVFSSNRPDGWDTLPPWPVPANRDLWVYRLEDKRFVRLTDTPALDEVEPKALGGGRFAYRESQDLTTVSLAIQDSAILRVDTAIHYRYFTRTAPWLELDRPALSFAAQEGATQWGAHTLSRSPGGLDDGRPASNSRRPVHGRVRVGPPPSRRDGLDYLPDPNPVLLPGQVDFRNYTFESERNAPRAMPQARPIGAPPTLAGWPQRRQCPTSPRPFPTAPTTLWTSC